ncbi:hypothetical protein [Shewanella sp. KT0246]|nr:hypothetical protein [Shewanella sp. KT0246]GIU52154.1 hypothetical protein TUM4249_20440 [Shewanella sp. KT0246]
MLKDDTDISNDELLYGEMDFKFGHQLNGFALLWITVIAMDAID